MSLKDRITEDMKTAMRARETGRLGAIRLLLAAIKQREVDERITLDDQAVVGVVEKLLKQRRDALAQYQAAQRDDLAQQEALEIEVLNAYMPAALPSAELESMVASAVAACQATGPGDMGKVMAELKPKLAGRADMSEVSRLVKAALTR